MTTKHFVGFGAFEDWAAAVDRQQPVNADCIVDPGLFGKHGIALNKQAIVVSQISGREVLYCRVVIDHYQTMNHQPLWDADKHHRRAETAWAVVRAWLAEQGFTTRRAVVAAPRNLKLLDGSADCLRYDKETNAYQRA